MPPLTQTKKATRSMSDPQLVELEAHYAWMDEQDRIEAVRFDEAETRRETRPRRVRCGRCGWGGRIATHYLDQKLQLRVRKCPMCQRKNPDWRTA